MMNSTEKAGMAEALRLTRKGRLSEAAALLRGLLAGGRPGPESTSRPGAPDSGSDNGLPRIEVLPPDEHRASPREAPFGSSKAWLRPRAAADTQGIAAVPPDLRAFLDRIGTPGTMPGLDPAVGPLTPQVKVPVPDGARYEERLFTGEAGSRAYKIYVPSGYRGAPIPLVVMLHGCKQSPDDFAIGTGMNEVAEAESFLVAYPAQTASANASKCWNWFSSEHQQRDRGEPSLVAGMTRQIMRDFAVDPTRVYVAGLSAGGAAAAVLGASYPDLFAAIGVHSGLACGAARDVASAFTAMRQGGAPVQGGAPARAGGARIARPVIVFHGDRDNTVNPINGDEVIAQSQAGADLSTRVSQGRSAGGVSYTQTVRSDSSGQAVIEHWVLHGAGHAWSGGDKAGSYTDPRGPDASREMARFFLAHTNTASVRP